MKKNITSIGVLSICILLLSLSGCSSMSKEECQVIDWYAMGYQTGVQGQGTQAFNETQKACAEYKIKADFKTFKQGHNDGVNTFCSFERGLSTGKSGQAYLGICPREVYPKFANGFSEGQGLFCHAERGLAIGKQGKPYHEFCPREYFPSFAESYQAGFSQFCSFENGQQMGLNGESLATQCIRTDYPEYYKGYNAGITLYCSYDHGFNMGKTASGNDSQCLNMTNDNYKQGYLAGLNQFCTYELGFDAAMTNKPANPHCIADNIQAHQQGYDDGIMHINTLAEIAETNDKMDVLLRRIDKFQKLITREEGVIISPESSSKVRQKALLLIKEYQREIEQFELEYVQLQELLHALELRIGTR